MQMMPSCDQTGVPGLVGLTHFHSSTTSGSASLMSLRILPRVFPRQSPSSAILFEMSSDADWPWLAPDFFMFSSRCATWRHTAARTIQTGEQEQGEREQRRVGHPGRRHPAPCARATKLAMTVTVKAMDTQRWICRIHCSSSLDPPLTLASRRRTAWRTRRSVAASRRTSSRRDQRCGRWGFR